MSSEYQVNRDKSQIAFQSSADSKTKPGKKSSKNTKHLKSASTTTPAAVGSVLPVPQISKFCVHLSTVV